MECFTYENQGSETLLIYCLRDGERIDNFAKGMLQGNELSGILCPSFMQRNMEQYIKFPVTSKIPLTDFISRDMERETVLKLCLSIAAAVKEMEDYMLGPEKLILDPDYIFVDIQKKEASLVYLPVEEFEQCLEVREFILRLLSHMQFQLDRDVSYVAKLIHFLNQTTPWEFGMLKRYIENLMKEKETQMEHPQISNMVDVALEEPAKKAEFFEQKAEIFQQTDKIVEKKKDIEKKGGWIGKKERKEKTSDIPTPIPAGVPAMDIPGIEQLQSGMKPAENQGMKENKKKGFFHFGKKKKDIKKPEIVPQEEKTPVLLQSQETVPVYMEYGSSDEENKTVIMGGGDACESVTVFLGGKNSEQGIGQIQQIARITRRRTKQSMAINKEVFHIGRESSFVDFYIGDNGAIGSCHADIFEKNGAYYIMDCNSLNHTYVDGCMVHPMQSVRLNNGAVITLADEDFDFMIS